MTMRETHINSYQDWFQTPVGSEMVYKERSADIRRHFNSITWSAGVNYAVGQWVLKANVGKSFRVPIPKELGADGINYHIFRYERGNASWTQRSRTSWMRASWDNEAWEVQVDPYLNYFPNYIYLNPTSQYVEGLQLYHYTQARVLRYGVEAQVKWSHRRAIGRPSERRVPLCAAAVGREEGLYAALQHAVVGRCRREVLVRLAWRGLRRD